MPTANVDKESDKEEEPYIFGSSRRYGKGTGAVTVENDLLTRASLIKENLPG